MDLLTRTSLPIIRKDGINNFPISDFSDVNIDGYTYKATGERFGFLEELKKCCLFGDVGVLTAFSNVGFTIDVLLTIGRIQTVKIPDDISKENLVIIAAPKYSAIMGNTLNGEAVFPYFQYKDNGIINITCSAFQQCPGSFAPRYFNEIYLGFSSEDPAIQLLQKSIWEFSQNQADFSIVLLYASIEMAVTILSGTGEGKISARINALKNRIRQKNLSSPTNLSSLNKKIEKYIIKERGKVAHKGLTLIKNDLFKSFEVALEFFWHYSKLKELCGAADPPSLHKG